MIFKETLTINSEFSIDEENELFRYKSNKNFVILGAENIISCFFCADIDSVPEDNFVIENVEGFGKVPLVKDISKFSRDIRNSGLVLHIHYLDKDGKKRNVRKKYAFQDTSINETVNRVNKMIKRRQ